MRLFIAEKPSMARAIATALGGASKKHEGYLEMNNGDRITWCIGHLLTQAEPDAYDPKYKQWRQEHLPIWPEQWQLVPNAKTKKQLAVVRTQIRQADELVHAGDPDREGQLLVDEVINYSGCAKAKVQGALRLLISDLTPKAIQKSLQQLKSNRDFVPLSTSALARTRADWLYGMNLTRAYTLLGRRAGYQGVLSIGRVQTPVLALVVQRDAQIENFQPKAYYQVWATLTGASEPFKALWLPSEACADYLDEENRLIHPALAQKVADRIKDQDGVVKEIEDKSKSNPPPLPFNLSSLQIEANKAFGMGAQQVLDIAQELYERDQLITYPRSDCRYLPKEQLNDVPAVSQAVLAACADWAKESYQFSQQSRCWNDSQVGAHHAIIPTIKQANLAALSEAKQKIYRLVARNYLFQFMAHHKVQAQRVLISIDQGLFEYKQKALVQAGWRALAPEKPYGPWIELQRHQALHCSDSQVDEKWTQPPAPFTEATLLAAMTGIARHVSDPSIKQILRETDGLGTEATRASIIELLFKRQYLSKQGKQVRSTPLGQHLIASLPSSMQGADRTALWEQQLAHMSDRKLSYGAFMTQLQSELEQLLQQSKETNMADLSGFKSKKPAFKTRRSKTASRGKAKAKTA